MGSLLRALRPRASWSLAALALFSALSASCLPESEDEATSQEEEGLRYTAWSVVASLDALHDELVLAQPEGTHDRTLACAGGGTATITGTTTIDMATSTRSVDLTFVLTGCAPAPRSADGQLQGDVTFDGTATKEGSASSISVGYTYAAVGLQMEGYVTAYGSRHRVNRGCDLSVEKKTAGSKGTLCGSEVAW
ncbi:MAG: hypothetical protein IT376_07135 [Polyangiaceae bacterium]|nr:hypothetical protein [Polyangiaceae bacterium]